MACLIFSLGFLLLSQTMHSSNIDGRCCKIHPGCGHDAICVNSVTESICSESEVHVWCHQGKQTGGLRLSLVEDTHCLDGSKAGYYYSPATVSPDTYVIYLQGGGACNDEESCVKRTHSNLGSSTKWPTENDGQHSPFLLSDSEINPDFYGAHRVFVGYCTGDSHRGTQTSATNATFGLWFSGSLNFKSIIEDLKRNRGLNSASHVLLTGSSAGAVGTFHQVDRLQSYLSPTVVVKAAPVSGWFMPAEIGDFDGKDPHPSKIAFYPPSDFSHFKSGVIEKYDNATFKAMAEHDMLLKGKDYLLPACFEDHQEDFFVCGTADTYYQYVKAPIFVIENRFDKYAIENEEGVPTTRNEETQAYLRYYGRATLASVAQVGIGNHSHDGLFLASCYDHTGNFAARTKTMINGTTFVAPVGDWFWDRNKLSHRLVDDCGDLPCNYGCH